MARTLAGGTVLEDGPILVTGAGGFAGRHLMYQLEMGEGDFATDLGDSFEAPPGVARLSWRLPGGPVPDALRGGARYIVHLAGVSSVAHSGMDAAGIYSVNTAGTAALLDWAASSSRGARILFASSSEVYGPSSGRLSESSPLAPRSAYGGSKAAAEEAVRQFARSGGLDTVIARPFPHFGPWQDARFALPSFCRRIIEAARGGTGPIPVGNLAPVRDYTYIGDVVEAYSTILARGRAGTVYNIASGEGRTMAAILDILIGMSGEAVEAVADPSLLRESDVSVQVGSASRLEALGWRRRYTLEEGLRLLLGWWEERT